MPKKRYRITPFGWLMLFFLLMLALGVWMLVKGPQPPGSTHSLPYTV